MIAGMKKVQVFTNVQSGNFVTPGMYGEQPAIYMEVTNDGDTAVSITVNEHPEGGKPASDAIPVASKTTRSIPMQVYNWSATGNVTVVGYKV